jgi:hypothetical protein
MEKINQRCLICVERVGNRLSGPACFLLPGCSIFSRIFRRHAATFGQLLKCIHYTVSIAHEVSNTVWAFQKS